MLSCFETRSCVSALENESAIIRDGSNNTFAKWETTLEDALAVVIALNKQNEPHKPQPESKQCLCCCCFCLCFCRCRCQPGPSSHIHIHISQSLAAVTPQLHIEFYA